MEHLDLAQEIDIIKLYDHIYNLQGTRHVIVAPKALEEASNYTNWNLRNLRLKMLIKKTQLQLLPVKKLDFKSSNILKTKIKIKISVTLNFNLLYYN